MALVYFLGCTFSVPKSILWIFLVTFESADLIQIDREKQIISLLPRLFGQFVIVTTIDQE